jgi:hypothetical protein
MTWLADHRATHGPDSECDGCRPPDTVSRKAATPPPQAWGGSTLRPDLVIRPGTNRK